MPQSARVVISLWLSSTFYWYNSVSCKRNYFLFALNLQQTSGKSFSIIGNQVLRVRIQKFFMAYDVDAAKNGFEFL